MRFYTRDLFSENFQLIGRIDETKCAWKVISTNNKISL